MELIATAIVFTVGAFVVALHARHRWIPWLIPVPWPPLGLLIDSGQSPTFDMPHFFVFLGVFLTAFLSVGVITGAFVRLGPHTGRRRTSS